MIATKCLRVTRKVHGFDNLFSIFVRSITLLCFEVLHLDQGGVLPLFHHSHLYPAGQSAFRLWQATPEGGGQRAPYSMDESRHKRPHKGGLEELPVKRERRVGYGNEVSESNRKLPLSWFFLLHSTCRISQVLPCEYLDPSIALLLCCVVGKLAAVLGVSISEPCLQGRTAMMVILN